MVGRTALWLGALALVTTGACTPRATVEVKPIRVEPIHITVDVNVRVQKEIDKTFDYLYGDAEPSPEEARAKDASK